VKLFQHIYAVMTLL